MSYNQFYSDVLKLFFFLPKKCFKAYFLMNLENTFNLKSILGKKNHLTKFRKHLQYFLKKYLISDYFKNTLLTKLHKKSK